MALGSRSDGILPQEMIMDKRQFYRGGGAGSDTALGQHRPKARTDIWAHGVNMKAKVIPGARPGPQAILTPPSWPNAITADPQGRVSGFSSSAMTEDRKLLGCWIRRQGAAQRCHQMRDCSAWRWATLCVSGANGASVHNRPIRRSRVFSNDMNGKTVSWRQIPSAQEQWRLLPWPAWENADGGRLWIPPTGWKRWCG